LQQKESRIYAGSGVSQTPIIMILERIGIIWNIYQRHRRRKNGGFRTTGTDTLQREPDTGRFKTWGYVADTKGRGKTD